MINFLSKYLILSVCLPYLSITVLYGQIVDSKNTLSLSAGNVMFAGKDNLFFPKKIDGSFSFKGDYLHSVLPWLKIGVEGSLVIPGTGVRENNEFITIVSNSEKFVTTGINATFNLPYQNSGWRNRLRLQFGIAPLAIVHLGERTVTLDNKVWNNEDEIYEDAIITMKGPKTGIGLSFTPAVEYYLSRNTGIRLSFSSLFTSMRSDLTKEDLLINSLNIGVFVQLPKKEKKELNY